MRAESYTFIWQPYVLMKSFFAKFAFLADLAPAPARLACTQSGPESL
jgi:hypothetical protein